MREFKKDRLVNLLYKVSIITFAGLAVALAIDYYMIFDLIYDIVANTHDYQAISGM
jgi:hypothetical protein